MNTVELNQLAGNLFIFLLGCFSFFIVSNHERFSKHGRMVSIYIAIFLWFASMLRELVLLKYLTPTDGTIINGFASLLPLLAGVITYFIDKDDPI